ncbi:hypothetical protein BB559_004759 [Furculomyces boomerangus]|uniref:Uncharacterized protein n=1 Tax=Furculomyces boomerangus TaxID=61424 RepID=A0A2T9YCV4_9FUNG|nr:hypothetical protein BB559_004759 [Furculomyces boomerangus]
MTDYIYDGNGCITNCPQIVDHPDFSCPKGKEWIKIPYQCNSCADYACISVKNASQRTWDRISLVVMGITVPAFLLFFMLLIYVHLRRKSGFEKFFKGRSHLENEYFSDNRESEHDIDNASVHSCETLHAKTLYQGQVVNSKLVLGKRTSRGNKIFNKPIVAKRLDTDFEMPKIIDIIPSNEQGKDNISIESIDKNGIIPQTPKREIYDWGMGVGEDPNSILDNIGKVKFTGTSKVQGNLFDIGTFGENPKGRRDETPSNK